MENKDIYKRWMGRLLAVILAVMAAMALLMWIIDPYCNYRAYDHRYKLEEQFSTPGLIKNWSYDSLVIGSSMAQNFDPNSFREELGLEPLKATTGGMNNTDLISLLRLGQESGHAENYFICIDPSILSKEPQECKYPSYLMDHSWLNDYRYWFGYEAWTRYIPLDMGLLLADRLGIELPQRWKDTRSIDSMSGWAYRSSFGSEEVLKYYADTKTAAAVTVDLRELDEDPIGNCDRFLSQLDLSRGNYVFFIPPYSSLFWYDMKNSGEMDDFLEVKEHFISHVSQYDNVQVFDFQGADFTADLDKYMDLSHYSPDINHFMVECFASGEFRRGPEGGEKIRQDIERNIAVMLERYPEILELNKEAG